MKRVLVSCVLICVLCLAGLCAQADTEGNYEYYLRDDGAVITAYNGHGGNIVLPDTMGGQPLVEIEGDIFEGLEDVELLVPADSYCSWYALFYGYSFTALDALEMEGAAAAINKVGVPVSEAKPGDIILMGTYPQSGAWDEPIEWIVLQKQGDAAFVISRYLLDGIPYHYNKDKVTWEECSLRGWLNGDFYNNAFTEAERAHILETKTGDEYDHVFLLSRHEAIGNYLGDSFAWRRGVLTKYALESGVYNENGLAGWWLRTRGRTNNISWAFASGRDVSTNPDKGYNNVNGVRPAMWVVGD